MVAELDDSFAVIGDVRSLPAYSLALTRVPGVDRLSDLAQRQRVCYLADVDLLASAVENVCRRRDEAFRSSHCDGDLTGVAPSSANRA